MTHNIESPRDRLARLRAEVDERRDAASAVLPVKPGDQIHAKLTGVTFATGRGFLSASHVTKAGQTYTVTSALIEASYSASGRSWLSHLVSEDQQLAAWGEVRFGLGPAPEGIRTWNRRGDSDWVEQREQARKDAWAMPTAEARAEALAAVAEKFGPPPTTSTIISTTPDPSIKLAAEQQRALDEGGVRHVSHYEAREPGVGERR